MPDAAMENLRVVNRSLQAWLARFPIERNAPMTIAPTELTDLLAALRGVSACLRSLPAANAPDAELASEISAYRRNVQLLQQVLPSVQGRLLIEKARLQIARAHVAKAAAWAQVSQKTL